VPYALDYAGLFLASFLAATILPAQSEAVLAAMTLSGAYSVWGLVAVASVGNVLGAVVNWLLGRFLSRFEGRRWFPVSRAQVERAEGWYRRWGKWSLLLSWLPVVGDPLTVVAGVLREPLPAFLILVTIGKVGRYVVIALVAGQAG
jgi:membrane protein YqaA with SNARE-associated domain